MDQFDVTVFHLINNLAGKVPAVDFIMKFFAQYALPLYAAFFIVAWFALPRPDVRHRHALFVAGCAGVLALLINLVIAHLWFRPRPFVVLPKGTFHQLIPHPADASFPSDHVAGGFGFASASWGTAPKWISYFFTVVSVIVMVARVYVGVHWPTDVLGGMVVGILAGKAIWMISPALAPLTRIALRSSGFGANVADLSPFTRRALVRRKGRARR